MSFSANDLLKNYVPFVILTAGISPIRVDAAGEATSSSSRRAKL